MSGTSEWLVGLARWINKSKDFSRNLNFSDSSSIQVLKTATGYSFRSKNMPKIDASTGRYSGPFKLSKFVDGETQKVKVSGGPALVNMNFFNVDEMELGITSGDVGIDEKVYIFIQFTHNGTSVNTPTLEKSSTFFEFETGKLKVPLGALSWNSESSTISGVKQYNYGAISGVIWGSCQASA